MSFFRFVESCFTDPYATLGRIQGGAKIIKKNKELILPIAIKMTGSGLSTWVIGKLTGSSFICKCSISAPIVACAYLCWENGTGTTEHITGRAKDFANGVDSLIKKAGNIWGDFCSEIGIK